MQRFQHDRFVPELVRLGTVSLEQYGDQAAHAAGLEKCISRSATRSNRYGRLRLPHHLYCFVTNAEIGTPASISALRLVSAASMRRHTSSTASSLLCGSIATPASSAHTRSPGLHGTPRISTMPFTSTVCMRHLPVMGVKPRHHTGQPMPRY